MSINIKIGLVGFQPGYEIILHQEGIFFEKISWEKKLNPDEYSAIIVAEKINSNQKKSVINYLHKGGAALFESDAFADIFGTKIYRKKVSFCLPEKDSFFSSIGLIDIYNKIGLIKKSNLDVLDRNISNLCNFYYTGSIYKTHFGKGWIDSSF